MIIMRKINYYETLETLKYATLTCKQISIITGHSMYASKKIRLEIINHYNKFPYTQNAHVRTDHFIEWYDSKLLTKMYNEIYKLNEVVEIQPSVFLNELDKLHNPVIMLANECNENILAN